MSGFKRFCLIVFALAGTASLVGLALTCFGPWTEAAYDLLLNNVYLAVLQVCMLITIVGFIVCFLSGLFSKKVCSLTVTTVDGGTISVTRDAIVSQAKNAIEAEGMCSCDRVRVIISRNNTVQVAVWVLPQEPLNIVEVGPLLHSRLEDQLAAVCGDKVTSIDISFVEGAHFSPHEEEVREEPVDSSDEITTAMEPSHQPAVVTEPSSEIRLPMTSEHEQAGSDGAAREA